MNFYNAVFEAAFGKAVQLPESTMPEIAFSGRSNVGKSTLINKLFNRKALARVSSTPGKTATVNFYKVNDIRLVDLPGYGYAKVSNSERERWSVLMQAYFNGKRDIRLVIQLIDMRHPPTKDDLLMLHFLAETKTPFLIALTKSDKLNKTERTKRLEAIHQELELIEAPVIIPFSSITSEGVEEIKNHIEKSIADILNRNE